MRFLLVLLMLAACTPSSAIGPEEAQWRLREIEVRAVDFGAERVGRLRYRGGLELVARGDRGEFGGLSALEVLEDGRVVAVSDDGQWVQFQLVLDPEGALVGAADFRSAPLRDENGAQFPNKEAADAEGLAQLLDGRFAVSFEQTQSIRIYDLNRDGPFGPARAGPSLLGVSALPLNGGLEAISAAADGSLLIGAEGGAGASTPLWVAPVSGRDVPEAGAYPLQRGYALTGLDRLPNGAFVALERFFAPVIGARARLTRFELGVDREVAPEELALLAPPLPVDNFEGVAAARAPDGGVRLHIISDDNFSARQRTLLFAFDLAEEPGQPASD